MGVVCRCWSHALLRIGIVCVRCVLAAYLAIRKLGSLTQPEQKHKHESPLHPQGGETVGRFFRVGGGGLLLRIWGNYVQILSLRFRFGVARALPVFIQIHVNNTPVFSQSRLNKSPSSARAPSTKSYSSAGAFSTKSYLLARAPSTKCLFRLDPLQQNPRFWPEPFQNKFARRQGSCNKMSVLC